MDLAAYRARAQDYATTWGAAYHRRFAGHDRDWDPATMHAAFADCWSDETLASLATLAEGGHAAARRLWRFAVTARLRAVTAAPDAERARRETEAGLPLLTARLAVEPDPRRRHELEQQRLGIAASRLTEPGAAALERVRREIRSLGWPSARAMWTSLTGHDPGVTAARAEALLRDGDPPALAEAWSRADLPRWHRAAWADPWYPADELVPSLRTAIQDAGVDADRPGFTIDAEARVGKSPRAFCAAVHVPQEIHLVVLPAGGRQDAEAVFHEAGHALLLAARDDSWPFEDRHLVPHHITEAAAFAFEMRVPDHGEERVRDHATVVRELRRRRQAARMLHELDLLDHGALPELGERYARRMTRATGLDWPAAPWLVDADPLLTAADYVRADLLMT
jgi:hypothetical protein